MSSRWITRGALAVSVLSVGALASFWGTQGSRADAMGAGGASMVTMGVDELCLPPGDVDRAIAAGATLNERWCAGCHDRAGNGIGPSYEAIVASYRAAVGGGSVEGRLLGAFSRASTHPPGAWPAYARPLSPPLLSQDERNALGYWMFRGSPPPAHSAIEEPR